MHAAITELTIVLATLENNEPINRASGNVDQADLEARSAADIRQALAVLKAATNGPIWPDAPASAPTKKPSPGRAAGGHARAIVVAASRRKEIAVNAAKARWAK